MLARSAPLIPMTALDLKAECEIEGARRPEVIGVCQFESTSAGGIGKGGRVLPSRDQAASAKLSIRRATRASEKGNCLSRLTNVKALVL